MFGLFSPRCPLDTWEKTWTEWRMRWLAEQFGIARLLQAQVVCPTPYYFPDPYHGTEADARLILDRLCGFMGINSGRLTLEVCADFQLRDAAGHYDRSGHLHHWVAAPLPDLEHADPTPPERTPAVIRVAESKLANPWVLTAVLAHELSHELLLGGGLLGGDEPDHEWITDLLPVFLGVGVFAANATIEEEYHSDGNVSWWRMARLGYLPARVFGYAFALFAFLRGEEEPLWARHLRLDAVSTLRDGLRYLGKAEDTLFHPDTAGRPQAPMTPGEAERRLRDQSPTVRLGTLWDLRNRPLAHPEVIAAVVRCLEDRDAAVPAEAARTLVAFGPAAAAAAPQLRRGLWSSSDDIRAESALALGALAADKDDVIPELALLLEDRNPRVMAAAAEALGRFGPRAEPEARRLLPALERALVECDHSTMAMLAETLLAITPDPKRHVRNHFAGRDDDLRRAALDALKRQRRQLRRAADADTSGSADH